MSKGQMCSSLDLDKPMLRNVVASHAPPGYEPVFMVLKHPPSVVKKRAAAQYGDDALCQPGHWQLQYRKSAGGFVAVFYDNGTTVYARVRRRKLPNGDTPRPDKRLSCTTCAASPAIVQTGKCGACQFGDLGLTDPERW